jgi:hypothetical protein
MMRSTRQHAAARNSCTCVCTLRQAISGHCCRLPWAAGRCSSPWRGCIRRRIQFIRIEFIRFSHGPTSHFEVHTGDSPHSALPAQPRPTREVDGFGNCHARSGARRRSTNPGHRASITGASPPTRTPSQLPCGCPATASRSGSPLPLPSESRCRDRGKDRRSGRRGGLDKGDMRVGEELGAGLRQQADEGIVLALQNQRGHGDAVHHPGAGGAVVVVVGIAETRSSGPQSCDRTGEWSAPAQSPAGRS